MQISLEPVDKGECTHKNSRPSLYICTATGGRGEMTGKRESVDGRQQFLRDSAQRKRTMMPAMYHAMFLHSSSEYAAMREAGRGQLACAGGITANWDGAAALTADDVFQAHSARAVGPCVVADRRAAAS